MKVKATLQPTSLSSVSAAVLAGLHFTYLQLTEMYSDKFITQIHTCRTKSRTEAKLMTNVSPATRAENGTGLQSLRGRSFRASRTPDWNCWTGGVDWTDRGATSQRCLTEELWKPEKKKMLDRNCWTKGVH